MPRHPEYNTHGEDFGYTRRVEIVLKVEPLMMLTPPLVAHEPPSLPSSPLPKRTKIDIMSSNKAELTLAPPPTLAAQPPLLVKKLSSKAKTPTRGSIYAAGYDLYAATDCVIPKRGKGLVDTDLAIAVSEGCCKSLLFST